MQYVIRMTCDATLSHLDEVTRFKPYAIRVTCLLAVSHPDALWPLEYVIQMT